MRLGIGIEDIEYLRSRQGIDDVQLRAQIRGLRIGDYVRLTFLLNDRSATGETLLVRITKIQGERLKGQLADQPGSRGLAKLRRGTRIDFATAQIHSVAPAPRK